MSDKSVPSAQRRHVPDELGRQFLEAFSPWRSQILSLHDSAGETLWLSEGSIGPDEHDVVLAALDVFALEPRRPSIYRKLEDGRRALFLVARDPMGGCSGIVFGIIEGGDVEERRVITPAIRSLLQRFSMLLAPPVERRASMAAAHARTHGEFSGETTSHNALPEGAPIHARCYTRLQPGGGTRRFEVSITPVSTSYDASVIERVAEWLAQNRQRYLAKPSTFAIAVSAHAALDARFAKRLDECLSRHELGDGMLMLVLPRAAWSAGAQELQPLLAVCERTHCHVILDDFALSETALELLRSKAVRMVKLDAELTSAAIENRYPRALLAACTQIARVLGLHLVAKNVTTPVASRWLANAGVDYVDPINPCETDVAKTTGEQPVLRQVS